MPGALAWDMPGGARNGNSRLPHLVSLSEEGLCLATHTVAYESPDGTAECRRVVVGVTFPVAWSEAVAHSLFAKTLADGLHLIPDHSSNGWTAGTTDMRYLSVLPFHWSPPSELT